jgi:hypothetical protein
MGRVRVRIFGLHTHETDKIKTGDLPWAHTMMPNTSASISGVGFSPTGLVPGSWVLGFFADGENMQDPIVLGSVHGWPLKDASNNDNKRGFQDPDGHYPRWVNDSDTNYCARDKWKEHIQYVNRYGNRVQKIDKATKPTLHTASSGVEETRKTWDEPEPRRGFLSYYPNVHTFETEAGIVREYDDSISGVRITEYHPAGTFYEILPDGDKVTKVSGDKWEIIIADNNVLVKGHQSVTIDGDARLLVKGDMITEVNGDYNLKIHGNRYTKITGNDFFEVIGNYNLNVKEDFLTRVGKNQTLLIDKDKTESIGGKSQLTVTGKVDQIYLDTYSMFSNGAQSTSTNSTQQFLSKEGLDFGSKADWILNCKSNMTINVDGSFNINAGPTFKVLATKVELN